MIHIGITGASGFIGWHLRAFLHPDPDVKVTALDRDGFNDTERLRKVVAASDAIVHLAGANRGDEHEVRTTNIALATQLVDACLATGAKPHVVFANSTHATRATPYGESKRTASAKLASWAQQSGAMYTDLVMPHVFGEGCKPFYNSAIATFCHQLAKGETPQIITDDELELLHVQRVAEAIKSIIAARKAGQTRLTGSPIRVSAAVAKLKHMAEQYAAQIIPELASPLELDLFNSYRSYLFPHAYPFDLGLKTDARGSLFEGVKTLRGGECFISTTKPGITRGNHYHRRKLERFLVIRGNALIRVRRLLTDAVAEFRVSGDRPQYVDMPTLHTHNIRNTGSTELMTLFWTQEIFDAAHPDTYPETV